MLLVKDFSLGDLKGTIYSFEKAGDVLPSHIHSEEDAHITIVAKGKLKVYSHDWELFVDAGNLVDFKAGEPHELMALEDDTKIFNIVKTLAK